MVSIGGVRKGVSRGGRVGGIQRGCVGPALHFSACAVCTMALSHFGTAALFDKGKKKERKQGMPLPIFVFLCVCVCVSLGHNVGRQATTALIVVACWSGLVHV